jgi:hypothetical protein
MQATPPVPRAPIRRIAAAVAGLVLALTLVAVGGGARGGTDDGAVHPVGVRLLTDLLLVVVGLLVLTGIAGIALGWIHRARVRAPRPPVAEMPWWVQLLLSVAHGALLGLGFSAIVILGSEVLNDSGLGPGDGLVPPGAGRSPTRGVGDGAGVDWPAVGATIVLVATFGAVWFVSGPRRYAFETDAGSDVEDPLAELRAVGLDELRRERDPRQAVIRAYAAMVALLDGSGLPRLPAETPFEYLDRVLVELGSSAAAAHRLTVLFEQAKFSHHPITAGFKGEAIAAVRALRAEVMV